MRRIVKRVLVARSLFATLILVASVSVNLSHASAQVEVIGGQQAPACTLGDWLTADIAQAAKDTLRGDASAAPASARVGLPLKRSSPLREAGQPGEEGTKCVEGVFRVHANPAALIRAVRPR